MSTKTALLWSSSSRRARLLELAAFAKSLSDEGWRLLAPAITAKSLREINQQIQIKDISECCGQCPNFGIMLTNRIIAGLMTEDTPANRELLNNCRTTWIDLIYVDLDDTVGTLMPPPGVAKYIVEETSIDIEGLSVLSAALRGKRVALIEPHQFDAFLSIQQSSNMDDVRAYRGVAALIVSMKLACIYALWQRHLSTNEYAWNAERENAEPMVEKISP